MSDAETFAVLKSILAPYAGKLEVKKDSLDYYYLNERLSSKKLQMFGAVQIKKRYVSFHLFPVYTYPDLLAGISPDLKKRMQGKSCFNFTSSEQILVEELTALVQRSFERLS